MPHSELFRFRVPFEESQPAFGDLLRRAWPELDPETLERLFERGRTRVEDRPIRRIDHAPRPEGEVEVDVEWPDEIAHRAAQPETLARGDTWVVVDKPTGMPGQLDPDDPMHPIFFLADTLGLKREAFTSVWPMPTAASGPWLFGTSSESADELRRAWRMGEMMTTWTVLVPRPDMPSGMLRPDEPMTIQYNATTMRDGIAELQLIPRWEGDEDALLEATSPLEAALDALAEAGMPALGDRRRGGYMVEGGLRARLSALVYDNAELQHSWSMPADWWPEAPVRLPPEERDEPEATDIESLDLPELIVTPEALDRLRTDERAGLGPENEIRRTGAMRPGTLVRIRDAGGRTGPTALFEGGDPRLARFWSKRPLEASDFDREIERRLDESIARRAPLLRRADRVERFRLVHGAADGLPGLVLDRFGPLLRATLYSPVCAAFKDIVYEQLGVSYPDTMVLELDATSMPRSSSPEARFARAGGHYLEAGTPLVLREEGLQYRCDPWTLDGEDLDPARRPHRRMLADRASADEHWLQLAPSSIPLSLVLADAGVHVVDCHDAYEPGERPEAAFEFNGLEMERYQSVTVESRRCPSAIDRAFDGMIVPWRRGSETVDVLLETLEHIKMGGAGLVYRETAGADLEEELRDVVRRSPHTLVGVEEIEPPVDVPRLEGVPESRPTRGWWLTFGE